jgi:hypothetical protein
VDKNVRATLSCNEPVTLCLVEPFYCSFCCQSTSS